MRAWHLIQTWVYGGSNLDVVSEVMEIAYGDQYVHMDWEEVFHMLQQVYETEEDEDKPETRQIFHEILNSRGLPVPRPLNRSFLLTAALLPMVHLDEDSPPPPPAPAPAPPKALAKTKKRTLDDLHALDMGVIDLTTFETGDEDASKAGPSEVPQKRQKTNVRLSSHFLDISALDDDEDDNDNDEEDSKDYSDEDAPITSPAEVLPGGRTSFASHLDDICRQYSDGTNLAGSTSNNPPRPPPFPIQHTSLCVYKVDIITGMHGCISQYHNLNLPKASAANYIRGVLERKSFKVVPGYCYSLYVEATSPKTILSAMPPSHQSSVRNISRVPTEEVASLYSPCELFTSAFWVWVKCGNYKNDIGYVLSRDGDQVDILVAPRERPYDDGSQKLLFDANMARLAGYAVIVDGPSDIRAGVESCCGHIYHKGLLRRSFSKKALEVVEVPHPDDLLLHSLAGIDPPLIHRTIKIFSAQFWRQDDLVCLTEGELRNTSGCILSVDLQNRSAVIAISSDGKLPAQYSSPILHLQRMYRRSDWVKVFAGSDRGTEGCVVDQSGERVTLSIHRHGEITEVCLPCTFFQVRATDLE